MPRRDSWIRIAFGSWLITTLFALAACGGHSVMQPMPPATPTPMPMMAADHVVLVVLENHSASDVLGNSAMPYFNSLVTRYSLAANYFANTHPSIGNYFMLTTGQIESNDDNFSGAISDDNIVRALNSAGKSWKAYVESVPTPGYTGGDVYPYAKHHNPFSYLTDVLDSPSVAANLMPMTQLSLDLMSGTLPAFAFVLPNLKNDAHDCPGGGMSCADAAKLAAADAWLKTQIDPLLNSPAFANSLLIITWDEGNNSDIANGGGQVATVLAGPRAKAAFQSSTLFQHEATLRLILDLLQVSDHPGASAVAPSMAELIR